VTANAQPLRVLIADGEVPSRAGLRAALEDGGVDVVAEARSAGEAIERARSARSQVSLIAARLPGGAQRAVYGILEQAPGAAVVVLADEPREDEAFAALLAGASGYVDREVEPQRLPVVVRAVAAGEPAVPRAFVATLLQELRVTRGSVRRRLEAERGAHLTDREWQILSLLDAGLTTSQIATRLAVSPVTVRRHVSRLVEHLGVADRAGALAVLRGAMAPRADE
jgi:DNA-binding NarL/FixJ family response regulator